MENYQLVAIFTYPSEYAVLELLLQQNEIRYVFQNATMVGVLPFHSNAVGGIRLLVHPNDIELTKEILNDLNSASDLKIV
ncbi:hypothetical protein [Aureitalea marina]|uniref:DUF2007 domain-containing protein n=1 Tax=Aureitalea marina TaxID=930804 RepID=A0A2S7KS45_9FLAO|nr:hypothetical protein [Aureitalea marina]PQB05455.1 hypothetical protein BST85_11555 [Aureitalea marina]